MNDFESSAGKVLEHPGSPELTYENLLIIAAQTRQRLDRPIDGLDNVIDLSNYRLRKRALEIGLHSLQFTVAASELGRFAVNT